MPPVWFSGAVIMRIMSYDEAVDYVYRIPTFTKKNTPEDTRGFYEYLDCPGEREGSSQPAIVHVAGTNGKGSVCSYVSSVMIGAGYHTAMFTSPHLVDIRERFRIDGEMMRKETFLELLNFCLEKVEEFRKKNGSETYHPTYFEILFFIAMLWFEQQNVDVIVLETGMGGMRDATNVIRRPAVSVITRIGLDHMEYLGDTKEKIAQEKAGIIKEKSLLH